MLNFREELDKIRLHSAEKYYLEEIEKFLEELLEQLKQLSPIELLSVRKIVIRISNTNESLFNIGASCEGYPLISKTIFAQHRIFENFKLVFELVLISQKLEYTIEHKPIFFEETCPAVHPAYEITVQI